MDILEETAQLFGLRKSITADGKSFWREDKSKLENGYREALYPSDIKMIVSTIGLGSIILDLGNVDYTTGALQKSEHDKCVWLLDGRRVNFSMSYGVITGSVTNEPDPKKPEPAFIDRRAQKPTGIRKCLHPDCDVMVDIAKKKSGCCSKQHMNFECANPACVARAEVNGWGRATHPFGTKIAKEHWQYKK